MDSSSEESFAFMDDSSCSSISDIPDENDEQTLNNGDYKSEKEYATKLNEEEISAISKKKRKKEGIKKCEESINYSKLDIDMEQDENDEQTLNNGDYKFGKEYKTKLMKEEISPIAKKKIKKEGIKKFHEESINYSKLDTEGQANKTLKESHHIDTEQDNNDEQTLNNRDYKSEKKYKTKLMKEEISPISKKKIKKEGIKKFHEESINYSKLDTEGQANETFKESHRIDMEQSSHNRDLDMSMDEEEIFEKEAKIQNGIDENQSPKNQRNISDRLIFEEDLDTNSTNENMSSGLKKILKSKSNLKLVSRNTDPDSFITSDDEIWFLKCPRDINIETLKGAVVTINDNMKIKAENQSYYGEVMKDNSGISLLTWDSKKFLVHHSNLMGTVDLQPRIPMPCPPDEDDSTGDETVSIPPLQCAHPLFGRHYKKKMKTPIAVTQCLSNTHTKENKKRKLKRERQYSTSVKEEPEPESQSPVKKKRKRKNSHCNDSDHSRKVKRIKCEHNSPVNWESAKSIEESLFNF